MSRMAQVAWSRKLAWMATSRSATSMWRRSVCMTASRSARVPPASAGAGSLARAGLAHRDDLVLVNAGAQQRRDPFDARIEGVGKVAVGFGRRRRRVGHQQKLGLCVDQRGGRGLESLSFRQPPVRIARNRVSCPRGDRRISSVASEGCRSPAGPGTPAGD